MLDTKNFKTVKYNCKPSLSFLAVFQLVAPEYFLFDRPAENATMGSHGIENQLSSPANDGVPMPSQTILTQSQLEISVTAQSSIPNRSGAEKGKATEVSDQDVKKTKLSVETRSHFEPHRTKANRVDCKHCKFDYYVATDSLALTFRPRCVLHRGCKYLRFCWSDIVLFFGCYNSLNKFDRVTSGHLLATYLFIKSLGDFSKSVLLTHRIK